MLFLDMLSCKYKSPVGAQLFRCYSGGRIVYCPRLDTRRSHNIRWVSICVHLIVFVSNCVGNWSSCSSWECGDQGAPIIAQAVSSKSCRSKMCWLGKQIVSRIKNKRTRPTWQRPRSTRHVCCCCRKYWCVLPYLWHWCLCCFCVHCLCAEIHFSLLSVARSWWVMHLVPALLKPYLGFVRGWQIDLIEFFVGRILCPCKY